MTCRAMHPFSPFRARAFAPSYTAGAADFDGTNDYMLLTSSGPTGLADGKVFTLSMWYNPDTDGTQEQLFSSYTSGNANRLQIRKGSGNALELVGRNSGGTLILSATSAVTFAASGGWYHVHVYIDLTNTGNRGIVINGTIDAAVTWATYTNDTLGLVRSSQKYLVGANGLSTPSERMNGALADVFFDDSYISDTTVFRNATTGKPQDLGSVGTNAVFFLHGSGNGFNVNSGTGGNFSITGDLGTLTPP